jgi:hypothetical protein
MAILLPPPPSASSQTIVNDSNQMSREWAQWFFTVWSILSSANVTAPGDATYIVNTSSSLLANAQVLGNLSSGFVKVSVGSGILTSTGSTLIQTSDLSSTGVSAGQYGSETNTSQITVGIDGRITSAINIPIAATLQNAYNHSVYPAQITINPGLGPLQLVGGYFIASANVLEIFNPQSGQISCAIHEDGSIIGNVFVGSFSGNMANGTGYTDAHLVFSDITTGDVSSSKHGFAPKGDGTTTKFLNANGTYTAPTGSIDLVSYTYFGGV